MSDDQSEALEQFRAAFDAVHAWAHQWDATLHRTAREELQAALAGTRPGALQAKCDAQAAVIERVRRAVRVEIAPPDMTDAQALANCQYAIHEIREALATEPEHTALVKGLPYCERCKMLAGARCGICSAAKYVGFSALDAANARADAAERRADETVGIRLSLAEKVQRAEYEAAALRAQAERDFALAAEWKQTAEAYRIEAQTLRDRVASLQAHATAAGSDPQTGGAGERGDDSTGQGGAST